MSFEALSIHLQRIARRLDEQMPDVGVVVAMGELEAEWKDRVFNRGEAADGSDIGQYSTKPAYYSKAAFIRTGAFKPKGKNGGGATFENGNPRKSMYLQGGYSELRSIQGRSTEVVNLKYGGSLERAFRVYKFGSEVLFGNADPIEHQKVLGNEERFGDWASLQESEKEYLRNQLAEQAIIITTKPA